MAQRNPQVTEVEASKNHEKNLEKSSKKSGKKLDKVFIAGGILGFIAGVSLFVAIFTLPKEVLSEITFPRIPSAEVDDNIIYSKLTGLELKPGKRVDAPTYCVQVPNGSTDGARPQAGLDEAGVVFEAIAESGITRFAAVFQEPSSAVIGPIRSLRIYYLEWDTPFDCAIVHAGGADDALAAVSRGYRDLTENYEYMYRSSVGGRLWNNLFTTAADLSAYSSDHGYSSSNVKGFSRMTPNEASSDLVAKTAVERLVITEPAEENTSAVTAEISEVQVNFGRMPNYNVVYSYDISSNTWLRSFASGNAHQVYQCPKENLGEVSPENACTLAQLAPSVVVVMVVSEGLASDNYHEKITVLGSGEAYIFQNGSVIRGKWSKASDAEQIKFSDASGSEIRLIPGQTFIEAVPGYGSVNY